MNTKILEQLEKINMTYGLNDIGIIPARVTRVEHRSDCNPYNFDSMLPLFTAPMNSIVNESNYEVFIQNKINTIIPRGVNYDVRKQLSTQTFVALSLSEFESFIDELCALDYFTDIRYICIDIANGHMKKLIDLCSKAKSIFGRRLTLMAGNIANSSTYIDYSIAGIDFVRVGIGGGSVCTTSANVGVHYPMASLIKDVVDQKYLINKNIQDSKNLGLPCKYQSVPFIIADGGFDNYDKIIKALALGSDYVMIGKLFAQCEEACGEETTRVVPKMCPETISIDDDHCIKTFIQKQFSERYRVYYGMSTKRAQLEIGNKSQKTSEGIEVTVPIVYTLQGWCDNFISYLRSAMSYTDSFTLEEFQSATCNLISSSEYLSYYK